MKYRWDKLIQKCSRTQKITLYTLGVAFFLSICLLVFHLFYIFLFPQTTDTYSSVKQNKSSIISFHKNSTVLLETEDAGKDYINQTLFLGDSNTVRFMSFTDTDGNTYTTKNNTIAVVGMGVQAIDSLECMEFSTGIFTMVDSVKILQPQRIIITFGTNNLSSTDNESDQNAFIETYTKQLQEIQDAYPSVDIIVNAIPPVSKSTIYTNIHNNVIRKWNDALITMCTKNDWHFLNSQEVLLNTQTGYAYDEMMDTDGLHLSKTGVQTLFQYIRKHAYITDDSRSALQPIPEIIGPKTNLYALNPLTGDTFDNSVLQPKDQDIQPSTTPEDDFTSQTTPNVDESILEPTPESTPSIESDFHEQSNQSNDSTPSIPEDPIPQQTQIPTENDTIGSSIPIDNANETSKEEEIS